MATASGLFSRWLLLAVVCCTLMVVLPGDETIPYHVAWIGMAMAYGFEAWSDRRTAAAIAAFTLVTGGILVDRAVDGVIAWEETAEIPLMSVLMLMLVWHVRRGRRALATITELAQRDQRRAAQRERLSRMTSHEMRTPATIALGYVDLLLGHEQVPARRDDLRVVREELERLVLSTDRLVRMLWITEAEVLVDVDVDLLLTETADRWSVLADREWQVSSTVGMQPASADRLRACLDTLVENAVRYTTGGDVVRLLSFEHDGALVVGVADGGPGLDPALTGAINAPARVEPPMRPELSAPDPKARTGLGLGLVHEVVTARGGRVIAGRAQDGGALLLMVVPPAGWSGDLWSPDWSEDAVDLAVSRKLRSREVPDRIPPRG